MQLVMEVMSHLDGAFALLIKSSRYPGELVACKRGSPLILGVKEQPLRARSSLPRSPGGMREPGKPLECFLASDASAVVEHTKSCALPQVRRLKLAQLGCGMQVTRSGNSSPCDIPAGHALRLARVQQAAVLYVQQFLELIHHTNSCVNSVATSTCQLTAHRASEAFAC